MTTSDTSYTGAGPATTPIYTVQQYLATRWSTTPPTDLSSVLSSTLDSLGVTGSTTLQSFLGQYSTSNPLPQNMTAFVAALVASVPGWTVANQGATIQTALENAIGGNLSLQDSGFDEATIAAALNDPALQPNSSTFYTDLYDTSFGEFLNEFNYTAATQDGTTPTVTGTQSSVNSAFFGASSADFFVKFASVVNTGGTSPNFQDIYDAFFGTNNADFTKFLANFISSVQYPTTGTPQAFLPNEEIGAWMTKVQQSYSLSLSGSEAPTRSSIANSFNGVDIINKVLAQIITLIGTLQQIAAAQSGQLRILADQQSAYTNLESQIPVFTSGDGTIFGSTTITSSTESQNARDDANNFDQTLTQTVQARRTTVNDTSQVLQSDITNSNNAANDQSSSATAILQTLSTILSSIYSLNS